MHICNKYYNNEDYTGFDLHMQKKSHNGTDFCPSGSVWLVLGTILMKRIVKVNAVKETRRKNKEELTFGGNLHKLSIKWLLECF